MSYQIIYDSKDKQIANKQKKRSRTGLMVCILGILAFGILRISGWGETLWQYMIPGDPEITTLAFQNFSDCLQNGQSISDAVFVFCHTVIQGAKLG